MPPGASIGSMRPKQIKVIESNGCDLEVDLRKESSRLSDSLSGLGTKADPEPSAVPIYLGKLAGGIQASWQR